MIVAPTLIKKCLLLRRLMGDLSNKEQVLVGLGLRSHPLRGATRGLRRKDAYEGTPVLVPGWAGRE